MRAFIVCGPEASGNNYMRSVLESAGCYNPFDNCAGQDIINFGPPEVKTNRLVFCRSFPTGRRWPRLITLIEQVKQESYSPTILFMVRDPSVCEASQVNFGHTKNVSESRKNIMRANREIMAGIVASECPFHILPYSNLGRPKLREWLAETLGLPRVPDFPHHDGDEKHL